MPTKVPTVFEQLVSKPASPGQREVKKVKDKMMTPELLQAMTALENSVLSAGNAKDLNNEFLEFMAQQQLKAFGNGFLPNPSAILKPKQVKITKPNPPKQSKAQNTYEPLSQQFSSLTNQEVAAEFVLNQYTSKHDQKQDGEIWCTICVKKFRNRSYLGVHLTRTHNV